MTRFWTCDLLIVSLMLIESLPYPTYDVMCLGVSLDCEPLLYMIYREEIYRSGGWCVESWSNSFHSHYWLTTVWWPQSQGKNNPPEMMEATDGREQCPSVRSTAMDKKGWGWWWVFLVGVSASHFVQCFGTVGLTTGKPHATVHHRYSSIRPCGSWGCK